MNKFLEKLKTELSGDLKAYKSIPFWSWNNELDVNELLKQIDDMHEAGIGGFIMHARTGLKTTYLGEKWFECIGACLKKARELNMNAWVYDENGWPSGFVEGRLLENYDFRARFLQFSETSEFDQEAYASFIETAEGYTRVDEPQKGVKKYHNVYLRVSPANTDILNPDVTDAFIKATHEEYYKRFADSFGRELVGFFTDEPQYYRAETPYTHVAESVYTAQTGKDIRDGLIWLFKHDQRGYEFRVKYYTILNELYLKNFYEKLYNWCTDHNCLLTGHSIEETCLHAQMWGGASCMSTYEYEHIPGMDCLGRTCCGELAPKQVGSVASQIGAKQVLTETFGVSGYDTTPRELRSLGEYQYFHGVNLMCQHLLPYSLSAQGKYDCPPVFSIHNGWYDGFRLFNDHFTRLGYLIANTREHYDVLVIHPMRSVYLDYIRPEGEPSIHELESSFAALLQELRVRGIQFQLADERVLSRYGKIENGNLKVGQNEYTSVIIPAMKNISATTLDLLQNYTGKLLNLAKLNYVDGKKATVSLKSNQTMSDIEANARLKFKSLDGNTGISSRGGELGEYIFIKNYSISESSTFETRGIADNYKALNIDTYELSNIYDTMTLDKNESLILIRDEEATPKKIEEKIEDITTNFAVTSITENYRVMDYASLSYDGEKFSEIMPLQQLFETLLRDDYKGIVYVKQNFVLRDLMPLKFVMEKGNYPSVKINGVELEFGKNDFDINFQEADITSIAKIGENELVYSVDYWQHEGVHFALFDPLATESLVNCLYFDTHIEVTYLRGDFVVNEDLSLSKRVKFPTLTSKMYKTGYPFFFGRVTLSGSYDYDGNDQTFITLDGRYMTADILINGKKTALVIDAKQDITPLLNVGKNDIQITLLSSLRNMIGPLHRAVDPEPNGTGPDSFTFRGTWNYAQSPDYTHTYNSVPFGVDKVKIIKRK